MRSYIDSGGKLDTTGYRLIDDRNRLTDIYWRKIAASLDVALSVDFNSDLVPVSVKIGNTFQYLSQCWFLVFVDEASLSF